MGGAGLRLSPGLVSKVYYTKVKGGSMDPKKPKLRWTPDAEEYILLKHRVRRETLDALMDAEDLSMVSSRLGRLMLQGTVRGKCYRLIVELVDRKDWVFGPVTGYRYSAGDLKQGGTA